MDPQTNQVPQQPTAPANAPAGGPLPPTPPVPQQPAPVQPAPMPQQPVYPQPTHDSFVTPEQSPFVAQQPGSGYAAGMAPAGGRKTRLRLIAIGVALLVVATLALVTYFAFFRQDDSASRAAQESSDTSGSQAIELASLNDVELSLPGGLSGYTEKDISTTAKQYISDDETCELNFGTVAPTELPGTNLDELVKPQIDQLSELGATIDGPNAGTALLIKDAAGAEYTMPTIHYDFSKDDKHAAVHYSAVILKGNNRAIISRSCANSSGTVDQARLAALDEAAKNIVVVKK